MSGYCYRRSQRSGSIHCYSNCQVFCLISPIKLQMPAGDPDTPLPARHLSLQGSSTHTAWPASVPLAHPGHYPVPEGWLCSPAVGSAGGIPAPPLVTFMTLGRAPYLPEPRFPPLYVGEIRTPPPKPVGRAEGDCKCLRGAWPGRNTPSQQPPPLAFLGIGKDQGRCLRPAVEVLRGCHSRQEHPLLSTLTLQLARLRMCPPVGVPSAPSRTSSCVHFIPPRAPPTKATPPLKPRPSLPRPQGLRADTARIWHSCLGV